MGKIAYICCTLPGRNQDKLFNSYMYNCKEGTLFIFGDKEIPIKYATTTRYEIAYNLICKDNYDYYMFIADDCEFTLDFEKNIINGVEETIGLVSDRRVCVYSDDGIHGINLATHPCFTKEWIDSLGYFLPHGHMRHCFVDNYIMELGKAASRIAYCENAKLIHHHNIRDKSILLDDWQQRAYSPEFYSEDRRRYEFLIKNQLADDVKKLLQ